MRKILKIERVREWRADEHNLTCLSDRGGIDATATVSALCLPCPRSTALWRQHAALGRHHVWPLGGNFSRIPLAGVQNCYNTVQSSRAPALWP